MNKNIKVILTYGIVGALCFLAGIKLYEVFNKDKRTSPQKSAQVKNNANNNNVNTTFKGMYSYFADANKYRLCNSDKQYPISMEGKYLELERKYLALNPSGREVYVELSGFIKEVKSMEEDRLEKALIIENLIKIDSTENCN